MRDMSIARASVAPATITIHIVGHTLPGRDFGDRRDVHVGTQGEAPDTAYLTSDDVRQLWQTGASVRVHGTTAVLRNWTEQSRHPLPIQLPRGARVTTIEPVRRCAPGNPSVSDDGSRVLITPGEYRATLELA